VTHASDGLVRIDSGPEWPNGPWLHLPAFVDAVRLGAVRKELDDAALEATRRDLAVPEMGNTPRRMSNLSARDVESACPVTWSLYSDPAVLQAVASHTAVEPVPLRDDIEAVVVNYLHQAGDTHGAHVDDHEVAFVLIVDAPPGGGGELLLHMPNGDQRAVTLSAGDAYVLHASAVPHAVAPITAGRRIAVVCAYDLAGRPQPHVTRSAALLYG
jgi:predicted 2-oxoglutarate/Fe(II)-dependent dioxygenase YbiX